MEYYSGIKRNEIGSFGMMWMNLEPVLQSEARKKKAFIIYYHPAKLLQSCPTLCDPRDGSPPGSPVPGILQARTLEWVAISFSNA